MHDTVAVLQMAVSGLELGDSPAQPVQSNVFFRQSSAGSNFAMSPCIDFVAEFSNSLSQRLLLHLRLWRIQILLGWAVLLK